MTMSLMNVIRTALNRWSPFLTMRFLGESQKSMKASTAERQLTSSLSML